MFLIVRLPIVLLDVVKLLLVSGRSTICIRHLSIPLPRKPEGIQLALLIRRVLLGHHVWIYPFRFLRVLLLLYNQLHLLVLLVITLLLAHSLLFGVTLSATIVALHLVYKIHLLLHLTCL